MIIVDNANGNSITVEAGSSFIDYRIEIKGDNKTVYLSKDAEFNKLTIKLKCYHKSFHIDAGAKNTKNLKFVSISGESQSVKVCKGFSCGGIEIQMNDGDERCVVGNGCHVADDTVIKSDSVITRKFSQKNVVIAGVPWSLKRILGGIKECPINLTERTKGRGLNLQICNRSNGIGG